ncbi:MAG: nuclear transport factor 2 family protein [Acidimicrobiales bacterium]|jgi:hypothetical protein|tara:strand:- start:197 stop:562 length:366 start_codon:yes stop_codon:yes gene_type:complete
MNDDALAREEQRWAALISNDFEALDSLVHASLTYTHSNAAVDTKESWIRSVTSGFVDYRSVEREDVAIISSGSTAVITGKATFIVGVQDNEITIVARFTAVWVNEDDRWQFYAWQNTPIPG